jgi:hypothetical protein
MAAAHGAPRHSTNRINFLEQDAGTTLDYTVNKTVTASPQPTGSWSQGQSTSDCNFAIQLQYLRARGHKDSSRVTILKLQQATPLYCNMENYLQTSH